MPAAKARQALISSISQDNMRRLLTSSSSTRSPTTVRKLIFFFLLHRPQPRTPTPRGPRVETVISIVVCPNEFSRGLKKAHAYLNHRRVLARMTIKLEILAREMKVSIQARRHNHYRLGQRPSSEFNYWCCIDSVNSMT